MKKNLKILFVLATGLSLFSCVRAEKEKSTKVTLNIPADLGQKLIAPLSLNSSIIPSSLSDINCFATLVAGPEPDMQRNTCYYKSSQIPFLIGRPYGGFFKGASANASMTFEVPSGKARRILLIGFKAIASSGVAGTTNTTLSADEVCAKFITNDGYQNYISDPYIISEQNDVDMKGDPLTLDMTASLDLNYKVGDCKGPDFLNQGSGSSGGIPYQFGLAFQDGLGTSSTKLSMNSCVGLRVQVQDTNGNRANIPTGSTIAAKISTLTGGNPLGTFYNPSTGGCVAANAITAVSNDITVSFYQGAQVYSDVVLFYQPSSVLSATAQLAVRDAAATAVLQPGSLTFQYGTGTPTLVSYSIYDLFNNRASLTSTATNHNFIKAGECRIGAVQFTDIYGVPGLATSNTGPYKSIVVNPSTTMQFFSTSSDCTAGVSSTPTFTAQPPVYSTMGNFSFFYKVPTAGLFTMTITNVGSTTTPALVPSGDNSSAGYWEAQ